MKFAIRVTGRADCDIRNAAAWHAERSGDRAIADRWVEGLHRVIAGLARNPDRCGLAHETVHFDYHLRELSYGSGRRKTHRILFRIDGNTVHIIAVRHFAQRDLTPDDL